MRMFCHVSPSLSLNGKLPALNVRAVFSGVVTVLAPVVGAVFAVAVSVHVELSFVVSGSVMTPAVVSVAVLAKLPEAELLMLAVIVKVAEPLAAKSMRALRSPEPLAGPDEPEL